MSEIEDQRQDDDQVEGHYRPRPAKPRPRTDDAEVEGHYRPRPLNDDDLDEEVEGYRPRP